MEPKNAAKRAAGRDAHPGDECEALDVEPSADRAEDAEDEAGASGEVELDLDDIDAPLDPDFPVAEAWELEALAIDDGVETEEETDETHDNEFDDEAEMSLLHELGIDLDAPDDEPGLDLELGIVQEDPADDGVAA
jgi:hypothetical protein